MDVASAGHSPQTGRTIDSDSRSLSESTPSLQPFSGTDSSFHSPKHGGSNGGSGSELSGSGLLDGRDPEEIKARVERKRLEHERQRALQRQAFEQQMKALEAQQREEEANLLHQQVVGAKPRTTTGAESAPTTPPFGSTKPATLSSNVRASSNSSPRHPQLSLDEDHGGAQEGLNGSNVPGLPPPTGARASGPVTRRSAGPEDIDAGVRRDVSDAVTGAFDRLFISHRSVDQLRAQDGGPRTAPLTGQQAVLQRAMARGNDATPSESGFTPVFGERFLFDDELDAEDSAFVKKYNLHEDDDKFPVLIHRDSYPGMLSASSAALDLAPLQQTPPRVGGRGTDGASKMSEWPQFREGDGSDHRLGDLDRRGRSERSSPRLSVAPIANLAQRQASIPLPSPSTRVASTGAVNGRISPSLGSNSLVPNSARVVSAGQVPSSTARVSSIDGRGSATGQCFVSQGHHRLSQHFSDSGDQQQGSQSPSPQRSTDQHLQTSQQLSQPSPQQSQRDLQTQAQQQQQQQQPLQRQGDTFPSFTMEAFANAPSGARSPGHFPAYGGTVPGARAVSAEHSRPSSGYFDAFANPAPGQAGLSPFGTQQAVNKFGLAPLNDNHLLGPDGQRKGELDVNTPLEDLQGEIFTLCKDQHGCRYLQKKLEEGVPSYRDMIFAETFSHFTELMTDPFGNYLCQKMLEYCTDEQRNLIVESVAPELVTISLNMHGTRAVQKTIDFLSTSRQIHSIIVALSMNVVTLIKDLNGNHVIQKCLNRLGAEDNQFIYNAVAAHCVEVATHRHGCCVLQRCIDHASEAQRMQLVNEITFNALTLVQDPFGNYVVQYILDLNDPRYSDAVIRQFIGNVCLLSVQKFSSNVIEKCIRVSDASVRKQLIEELLNRARLEKLLRDSFANYVVQTSLDYADPMQRMQLVECIRPILPMIRNTPYGKRIQSKLQRDNVDLGPVNNMPYSLLQVAHQQQLQAMAAMANRQVSAEYPGVNMGYNAHGMMQGAHMGQQMHHQPPPHMAHHYGGQGPPHLNQHRHPQHHMGGGAPMRGGMQQQHHAPYMGGPQGGAPHMGGVQGMHPNAYAAAQGYNGNMNSFNGMPPQMGMHQQHGGYPGAGYPSY